LRIGNGRLRVAAIIIGFAGRSLAAQLPFPFLRYDTLTASKYGRVSALLAGGTRQETNNEPAVSLREAALRT